MDLAAWLVEIESEEVTHFSTERSAILRVMGLRRIAGVAHNISALSTCLSHAGAGSPLAQRCEIGVESSLARRHRYLGGELLEGDVVVLTGPTFKEED